MNNDAFISLVLGYFAITRYEAKDKFGCIAYAILCIIEMIISIMEVMK